jgi:hypothetical protein
MKKIFTIIGIYIVLLGYLLLFILTWDNSINVNQAKYIFFAITFIIPTIIFFIYYLLKRNF